MNQSLSTSDRQPHLESPCLSLTQRLPLYSVAGSQARTWQYPRQNQTMEDECRFKHTTLGHGYVLKYSHARAKRFMEKKKHSSSSLQFFYIKYAHYILILDEILKHKWKLRKINTVQLTEFNKISFICIRPN